MSHDGVGMSNHKRNKWEFFWRGGFPDFGGKYEKLEVFSLVDGLMGYSVNWLFC
jgi:hypothetical protein